MQVFGLRGCFRGIPRDAIRAVLDETEELVKLRCLDHGKRVTVLAFNFERTFYQEPLKEQLMTSVTAVFGGTRWHKLLSNDSAEEGGGKAKGVEPKFQVIHNMLWLTCV